MSPSVLFIGKRGNVFSDHAADFVRDHFRDPLVVAGARGEPLPEAARQWEGEVILSFLSPWIVPGALLDRAALAGLNFHPGPPEYPGIGCTNFAIYQEAPAFGVTCHHMAPRVDTGAIVAVKRFPLYPTDSVLSLTHRCYGHLLSLFYDVASLVHDRQPLPSAPEGWRRQPYRRWELDELCRIAPGMDGEEIRRRVRAVTFPGAPGAFVEIDGMKYVYDPNQDGRRPWP
jgi:methionyl-tRNA formyltransferase